MSVAFPAGCGQSLWPFGRLARFGWGREDWPTGEGVMRALAVMPQL